MSKKPDQFLFVALSGIGNLLMQLPTIETFKRARPNARVTVWVAPRGTRALAEAHQAIDEVIEAPIKTSLFGHVRIHNEIARQRYTTGVVLHPGQHWKSAGHLWLADIPKRVGHQYPLGSNQQSGLLLTDAVPVQPQTHDVDQNIRLLEPLGVHRSADNGQPTTYNFVAPQQAQHQADELFRSYVASEQKLTVGFHMGSAPDLVAKRWPIERFVEVGKILISKHNAHILLVGGSDEAVLKSEVKQGLGELATVVDADLLTTAGVMKHCQAVLANDSGVMHLAAAVGAKTFGLFGPTDETRTGPRGTDSHVIRAPGTEPVFNVNTNFNLGDAPHETMLALKPEMVVDKITHDLYT